MDTHLDHHYLRIPPARPVFGEVTAVFYVNEAGDLSQQNWSDGAVTLYSVVINQQWPTSVEVLHPCYALGQLHAQEDGKNDYEDQYSVGDQVVVIFMEWDPNRGVILCRAPTWDKESPATPSTEAPVTRFRRRNSEVKIDKDAHVSLQLADGASFTLKDKDGTILEETKKVGGVYKRIVYVDTELGVGGAGSLQRLCTEQLITALKIAIGAAPVIPNDGGLEFKTKLALALDSAFVDANTTTHVAAK